MRLRLSAAGALKFFLKYLYITEFVNTGSCVGFAKKKEFPVCNEEASTSFPYFVCAVREHSLHACLRQGFSRRPSLRMFKCLIQDGLSTRGSSHSGGTLILYDISQKF